MKNYFKYPFQQESTALRDVNAPYYRYWQALYLAFFSANLYVDVGKRWRGLALGYLLLVIAIACIPFSARVIYEFDNYFNQQVLMPLNLLPPIYIQQGQVTVDKSMPYLMYNAHGQVVAIIDTTGKITTFDARYPALSILITRDKLFYRTPMPQLFFIKDDTASSLASPVASYIFTPEMNEVFEGRKWIDTSGIKQVQRLSEVMIYPVVVLVFFAIYVVFFLAFALMAQFIAKLFMKLLITYQQAFRLLVVSATPHLVVLLLLFFSNGLINGISLVLIGLFAGYYSFAVLALKRESEHLVKT